MSIKISHKLLASSKNFHDQDVNGIKAYLENNNDCYEVLNDPDQSLKAYLDIDGKNFTPLPDISFEDSSKILLRKIKHFYLSKSPFVILTSHSEQINKMSFEIIFQELQGTKAEIKEWAHSQIEPFNQMLGDYKGKINIDLAPYSTGYQKIRMYGSSKDGENRPKILVDDADSVSDTLISYTSAMKKFIRLPKIFSSIVSANIILVDESVPKVKLPCLVSDDTATTILNGLKPIRYEEREYWRNIGWALHSEGVPIEVFKTFSKKSDKYSEQACEKIYEDDRGDITMGSIFHYLKEDSPKLFTSICKKYPKEVSDRMNLTDEDLALYAFKSLENDIKYSQSTQKLYLFDVASCLWKTIKTNYLQVILIDSLKPLLSRFRQDNWLEKIISDDIINGWKGTQRKKLILSQLIALIENRDDDSFINKNFDVIPHLFPMGLNVFDFKAGLQRPMIKTDFFTKTTDNVYNKDWNRAKVNQYFSDLFMGRESLIKTFKQTLGYLLTNETDQKLIYVLYGPLGNNGKTTLTNILKDILQEFQCPGNRRIFKKSKSESVHSAELFTLVKRRAVFVAELGEHDLFNEELLKEISGCERSISARNAGSDKTVELVITGKNILSTNSIPSFEDPVFGQRLAIFPFDNQFEKSQEKMNELIGLKNDICSCGIDNAVEFYKRGMKIDECDEVKMITDQVRGEKNTVENFLNEKCFFTGNKEDKIKVSSFYDDYINSCSNSHPVVQGEGKIKFNASIKLKYPKIDIYRKTHWQGIRQKTVNDEVDDCEEELIDDVPVKKDVRLVSLENTLQNDRFMAKIKSMISNKDFQTGFCKKVDEIKGHEFTGKPDYRDYSLEVDDFKNDEKMFTILSKFL